jgi:hypothetical protein
MRGSVWWPEGRGTTQNPRERNLTRAAFRGARRPPPEGGLYTMTIVWILIVIILVLLVIALARRVL